VDGFKEKLEAEKDTCWSAEEARKTNVALTRPSHDAWGIGKVIRLFCIA
jgi:hypothetical protein